MTKLAQNLINKTPSQRNTICDEFFNFEISSIEEGLDKKPNSDETYEGVKLEESALNTCWDDYYSMILLLKRNNLSMLDIGSSYSKGTLLSEALGFKCISSVELIVERVSYSNDILQKLLLPKERVFNQNALNISFEEYDILFIYQPVSKLLSELLTKVAKEQSSKVWIIESHGDLINRMDLDSRFINKTVIMKINSKRHLPYLYQYDISSSKKNDIVKKEEIFYRSSTVMIETETINFGKIKWISKLNDAFIDYIENVQTISINNRRINNKTKTEKIIEFDPKVDKETTDLLNENNIYHNGKVQKILKQIVHPKGYLELIIDGIVKFL